MLLFLAFLSGTAGLVYEVLWARQLALLFGSTALAQTLVLSVFLGGLSAGGLKLGRRADRTPSPARLYARLEWGVALLGLAAPLLLRLDGAGGRWLAVCALLAQAFLMGGTIPALCRAAGGEPQGAVGRVYASNSAGAVLGCLGAGFVLIPALGLDVSFAAAAALNGLSGLGAWKLASAPAAEPVRKKSAAAGSLLDPVLVQSAVFLSGFVALTYEIAWTRALALALGSSVYSFAEMLAAFIAGASAGSLLAAAGPLRRREPARLLGLALLGAGVAVLASLPFYDRLPFTFLALRSHFGDGTGAFYGFEAAKFALCLGLMLPPAVCLGATLPLAVRLVDRGVSARGAEVGAVFSANAAGNVLGAFAGWLLLPWLGVEGILRSGTTVFALAGAAVLWTSWPPPHARRRSSFAVLFAALVLYRAWLPRWDPLMRSQGLFRVSNDIGLFHYADMKTVLKGATLVFERDDREATVTVTRFAQAQGLLSLKVNGKTDASNGADMMTQVLLGELPLMLEPAARGVLLVGWGSGVTAGSLLRHPISRLDAVELVPAVVDASRFFERENGGALRDPRLDLHLEDAKSFLARGGPAYDVIVSEPSNPWMAGVGDLFSAEFYARARARLAPDGLMVQWFHDYEMNDALFRMTLRTFRSSFPYVTLWNVVDNDVLLVGSVEPFKPDFAAMDRAFKIPAVKADLLRADAGFPATLLAMQSACEDTAAAIGGEGPLNEERRPRLEYGAPLALFRGEKVSVIRENDDRSRAKRRSCLLLASYLKARRRPLTAEEYFDQVVFPHSVYEKPELAELIRDWRRHYPKDALAAEAERRLKAL
ncbi:MAG TPA: fused MFS/spermidine synthase [Elusimicrobiota bacterium]|jgi:predicted membrane-bound spermidine synthase|nr:fused MFS/spermidine synthase [Elusimicrobiota bacterium]